MNLAILSFLSYTWFFTMVTTTYRGYRNWAIYFRHHDSAVVLPADDLADISAYLCFKKGWQTAKNLSMVRANVL